MAQTMLEPSLQGSRHDREALSCPLSGSCTPSPCCGRAERAQRGAELCVRSSSWSAECLDGLVLWPQQAPQRRRRRVRSVRGPEMSSSATRREDSSEPQLAPLRDANDAEKVSGCCTALSDTLGEMQAQACMPYLKSCML